MKATIWKYMLRPGDNKIALPKTAKPLSIGWQGMDLVMWVLMLDPDYGPSLVDRRFLAVVTGERFEGLNMDKYVGTAECGRDGIVAHVFEVSS